MTYEKILGCLIGGAAGDAMGAATEIRTREQIKDFFGSYVTEFLTPPDDTFARGCSKAQITDDFSIAYGLSRGWDMLRSAQFASAAAARAISHLGARSGAVMVDKVLDFMNQQRGD